MSNTAACLSQKARVHQPISALLFLGAVLCIVSPARADDQETIDSRKHAMKTMEEQVAIIDMIQKKRAPANDLAVHAKSLVVTAKTAKSAFEPKVVGGDAKAEVWAKWDDFAKRLDTLVRAADEVSKAADAGDLAALGGKLKALNCNSCHDNYRVAKDRKETSS